MKKVLGMGNALVDIMIRLEDDRLLDTLGLPKGSMQLVDAGRSQAILEKLEHYSKSFSAGGSAANTIHGLAMLGVPVGYIGVIGEDDLGGSAAVQPDDDPTYGERNRGAHGLCHRIFAQRQGQVWGPGSMRRPDRSGVVGQIRSC